MSASCTRKTVFLILTMLTVVMFFVSRHRLLFQMDAKREADPRSKSSFENLKPSHRLLRIEYHTDLAFNVSQKVPVHDVKTSEYSTQVQYSYAALDTLVEQYQQNIEKIRKRVLEGNDIKITAKHVYWELLDGYDEQLFNKVKKHENIIPVYLTNSLKLTREMLPAKKYYNHVASNSTCKKMDKNSYHGPTLLNKTCLNSIERVYNPVPLDRVQLSVGIPFKMDANDDLPIGPRKHDILLHFGFVVKDALILSHGIVFSNGSALQPQRCKPSVKTKVPLTQNSLPVYSEVFSMTEQTGTGFYHLTLEDLPRIAPYLNFLLKYKQIKIHCRNKTFSHKMLQFLGITKDRLIFGDVRAKVVYMPAGTACGRPGVFTTQLMSTLFHRLLPKEMLDLKQDTIVLIKRSSESRKFIHHEDILNMLKKVASKRGLRVVEYRDDPTPSVNKTLEIFYRAVMVVAPHGAGLSNLAFSRPGVVILESYCLVNLCFRNLMANIGHIHHGYMNEDFSCLHAKPENFKSDVEKHLDILGFKST